MPTLRETAICEENYRRFVERVVVSSEVWILSNEHGTANCKSHDGITDVILLFSDEAYARRAQVNAFAEYQPKCLDLFEVIYRWFPGMSDESVLAGPNWTGDLIGLEMDPIQVQQELYGALGEDRQMDYRDRFERMKRKQ